MNKNAKNPQQSIRKLNQAIYKKDTTSKSIGVDLRNARQVQQLNNQYKLLH